MAPDPQSRSGYGALRVGRYSCANSDYFVTGCLTRPMSGLTTEAIAPAIDGKMRAMESEGRWRLRSYVLMPDHFHLLFTLGTRADLSSTMRDLKGPLTPVLRAHGLRWQPNFYDHRLRPDEDRLPIFLYIFLNPYRAGLIGAGEQWPCYYCAPTDWAWFGEQTRSAIPFPEWLR